RIAKKHDLIVRVDARPGRFVTKGDTLLSVYPSSRASNEIRTELGNLVVLGSERAPEQDLEFAVRRLVEIAQRALSPGVNDPTTALYCLDRIEQVLLLLAERELASQSSGERDDRLRILIERIRLRDVGCAALVA